MPDFEVKGEARLGDWSNGWELNHVKRGRKRLIASRGCAEEVGLPFMSSKSNFSSYLGQHWTFAQPKYPACAWRRKGRKCDAIAQVIWYAGGRKQIGAGPRKVLQKEISRICWTWTWT